MQLAQNSLRLLVSLAVALLSAGCGSPEPAQAPEERPRVHSRYSNYVSLAPSNTELLYAIGAQDHLVAVSTQCDYPKEAKALTKGGNFETADLEKLASIRPDGIFLVNGQEAMQGTIEKQKAFPTKVVLLHNGAIEDIASNLMTLGTLTGHSKEASVVADKFRDDVQAVFTICDKRNSTPKVFFCVWPEPLVTIGNASYLDDAITRCGGKSISHGLPGAYPRFSVEKLMVEQPDVIIMPAEADHSVATRAPWSSLKAVKNKRLYFLPPRDVDRLSRPSLRTLEGLYWLAERIHPEKAKALSMSKNSISQDMSTTSK